MAQGAEAQSALDTLLLAQRGSGLDPLDAPDVAATVKVCDVSVNHCAMSRAAAQALAGCRAHVLPACVSLLHSEHWMPMPLAAAQEALFQREVQAGAAVGQHHARLNAAREPRLGQRPPSPRTVEAAIAARSAALQAHDLAARDAAVCRHELDMQQTGVLCDAHGQGTGTTEQGCDPASAASKSPSPRWLLLEANEWRKRVHAAERFIAAVRTVIYRNRAAARLHILQALRGMWLHVASMTY